MSDIIEQIEARLDAMERIGRLIQRSSLGADGEVETLRIAAGLRAVVALHEPFAGVYDNEPPVCLNCREGYEDAPWPCPTIQAIAAIWDLPA